MTTDEARREAVRLFVEKADEALHAARRVQDVSRAASVNRSYYACVYAASAVLIQEGRHFVKHAGVRGALHKHLVHEGRLDKELGDAYDRLMRTRQKADCEAAVTCTPQQAVEAMDAAERIVTVLRRLLP